MRQQQSGATCGGTAWGFFWPELERSTNIVSQSLVRCGKVAAQHRQRGQQGASQAPGSGRGGITLLTLEHHAGQPT